MTTGAYCIWIVLRPNRTETHSAYDEVALALREAFASLGYEVPIVLQPQAIRGVPIILGPGVVLQYLRFPPNYPAIIYNTEQVQPETEWFPARYIELMRNHDVWDYSPSNVDALREIGIEATFCGIGYMPCLTRMKPAPSKDIDILFIGTFHKRRHKILEELHAAGLNVVAIGGRCWGEERDALYQRAKIVINIHMHDAQVLEIIRLSYLLANRICVVSETGRDSAMETALQDGIAFAPYDKLVETCVALLADDAKRARIAEIGFERMSAISQIDLLADALKTARRA